MPDDQEWTEDDLDKMDDVRTSANRLAREIEATIETYEGKINEEES